MILSKVLIDVFVHRSTESPERNLGASLWSENMATNKPRRPDHTWAKASYEKAKKIIYGSQCNCGICGRPVDFDKKFPDPWSATLDHIIPISKGGAPADLENLQLAHLQCNRKKAAKLYEPQLKEKIVDNRDLPLSRDWLNYRGA